MYIHTPKLKFCFFSVPSHTRIHPLETQQGFQVTLCAEMPAALRAHGARSSCGPGLN